MYDVNKRICKPIYNDTIKPCFSDANYAVNL